MSAARQARLERSFKQEDFDCFARLSGDANPIHVDPGFAATTRFGRTVAHGMLLVTVLRGLVARLAPGARVAEQAVMFPAPTFSGEPLSFTATVTGSATGWAANAVTIELEVRRIADGVVTCRGWCRTDS
jgi:acyl dehydratase